MRIKEIHILTEYKNLKDFKIKFDGNSFVDVFVGKNGTGKSNFFEACLEILKHIYETDYIITFNYRISYTINETEIQIEWKDARWIDVNGKETTLPNHEFLPDNILIYYSGHNATISELIHTYERKHKDYLNRNRRKNIFSTEDTRRFFGVGADYKSLLLSVMLLQPNDSKVKTILVEKLGIKTIGNEIKIIFKRPDYAIDNKSLTFDEVDETKRFWSAEGYFKIFLDKVWNINKANKNVTREEGYIATEEKEEYILYRSLPAFREAFKNESPLNLFISFDNLKTIGLLQDVTIEVELLSEKKLNLNQFSDGQFQSVYIYAITELFKNKNCITLLDEPDSFLHPEWQFGFFKQVIEISSESAEGNHVLMSSHSAVTLLNSLEKRINLFEIADNKIVNYKVDKSYAINKLSSNLIKILNDKQILSVIHTVGQSKPILFTEGYSDPIILQEAWKQLYEEEMPFEIYFGHGCLYLRLLLQNEKFLNEMGSFPIFGLFDFDRAYNEWNSLPGEDGALTESDPYKGLIKKIKNRNSYAILVPVPDSEDIKKQVINGNTTFESESVLELEHLFYSAETSEHFHKVPVVGGGDILEISDSQKIKFATEVVPTVEKEFFETLRPMFEFIKSKC